MLSVLMQVMVVFSLISVLWAIYGYSVAFGGEGLVIANFGKLFLSGVTIDSLADTFTPSAKLPEYVFIAFQGTFASITCALIVGAFAERMKFAAVLLFSAIWFTFCYLPIAHMVWGAGGYLLGKGALDFAGGTVVHINAGVAGLVGAYMVGKRLGYGKESMAPHSLTLTMVGAAMLWVGWFGFNAGSNLEATGGAALAFVNTLFATAAAVLTWCVGESLTKGKASMLGAASGAVAGLVAITPACGTVGPMGGIVIGGLAGFVCLWGVNGLKHILGADDSLDVFGVHGLGGILGALLTGVFTAPSLGGTGKADFSIGSQLADPGRRGADHHRLVGRGGADRLQAGGSHRRPAGARGRRARRTGHHIARRDRVPRLVGRIVRSQRAPAGALCVGRRYLPRAVGSAVGSAVVAPTLRDRFTNKTAWFRISSRLSTARSTNLSNACWKACRRPSAGFGWNGWSTRPPSMPRSTCAMPVSSWHRWELTCSRRPFTT